MKTATLVASLAVLGGNLQGQGCPAGPNKVSVQVSVNVAYSSATKLYTYTYTLTNSPNSQQPVDSFTLMLPSAVTGVTSPTGWRFALFGNGPTAGWATNTIMPLAPGEVDDGSFRPPLNGIQPGATLSGFSFQSPLPPGQRPTNITGFAPSPKPEAGEDPEDFLNRCPDFGKDYFGYSILGGAQAPTEVGAMQIDIFPGDALNRFDPRSAGPIAVAIFSAKGFDATNMNPATLSFGRGRTHPTSWQTQDINNDRKSDLVLQFDIPATQTACYDSAMWLTGRTFRGEIFWGSDAISPVCP